MISSRPLIGRPSFPTVITPPQSMRRTWTGALVETGKKAETQAETGKQVDSESIAAGGNRHYTLYTIQYTLYTIHNTLYTIHYTQYTI